MSPKLRNWVVCFTLALSTGVLSLGAARAQDSVRPVLFEGEASADDVYVRSGDSANHYTICKLNAGDRVKVLGERGEWYEILPPVGTFSLISSDYVDTTDGKRGIVNGTNVRVRAGSTLNANKYTVQTLLGKGDAVTILGKNPDGFLKIEPPRNATLWINREYVQRIPDGMRQLEQNASTGSAPPASGADLPETIAPPKASPAGTTKVAARPATTNKPRMSRSLAQLDPSPLVDELARIDAGVNAELAKPVLERQLQSFLDAYQVIASQEEDEMAQRYASARATQVSDMIALIGTVREMKRLEVKATSNRRSYQAQRAGIRTVEPSAPSGLDAEGVLRRSSLYADGVGPERFRLVDESTPQGRTVAYVETPLNASINVEPMIGKFVGVRASSKRWQQGGVDPVPILVAQEVVLLESPMTQQAPNATAGK